MMSFLTLFILFLALVLFVIPVCIIGIGTVLTYLFPITIFQGAIICLVIVATAAIMVTLFFVGSALTPFAPMFNRASNYDKEDEDEDYDDEEDSGETSYLPQKKVGRNDPCPCGSGKKYKYCCGK
ncbi:MAG: SEC-C metal-binding domain-containing protein [bacterium]|nr:SEC-C metal-binding domain-containing protein [bacterium]